MFWSVFGLFAVTALVFFGIYFLIESLVFSRTGRVVFVGSNVREQGWVVAHTIERYCPDTEDYALVEPGSGLATMSTFLARRFSWKEVRAIELRTTVYWLARVRLSLFNTKTPIRFMRTDFFEAEFPRPAVVYCYLTQPIIDRLYRQGAFQDCLVMCLTFQLSDAVPTEIIPLKSWQQAVYVYDFRKLTGLSH